MEGLAIDIDIRANILLHKHWGASIGPQNTPTPTPMLSETLACFRYKGAKDMVPGAYPYFAWTTE